MKNIYSNLLKVISYFVCLAIANATPQLRLVIHKKQ